MAAGWIEKITGSLEDKRTYKQNEERIKALPEGYREVATAAWRYLLHVGGVDKGEVLIAMQGDLVDLFEQSAEAGSPIRDVVGDYPVEFIEEFLANYDHGRWINKERKRLIDAVDQAARSERER